MMLSFLASSGQRLCSNCFRCHNFSLHLQHGRLCLLPPPACRRRYALVEPVPGRPRDVYLSPSGVARRKMKTFSSEFTPLEPLPYNASFVQSVLALTICAVSYMLCAGTILLLVAAAIVEVGPRSRPYATTTTLFLLWSCSSSSSSNSGGWAPGK